MRFFLSSPLPDTASSFGLRSNPFRFSPLGARPSVRRLQVQTLSPPLARSGLSCPPPYPSLRCSSWSHLFVGGSRAPFVLRPCWLAARRFHYRSAKAHRVSRHHRCHALPKAKPVATLLPRRRHMGTPARCSLVPQSARPVGRVGFAGADGAQV